MKLGFVLIFITSINLTACKNNGTQQPHIQNPKGNNIPNTTNIIQAKNIYDNVAIEICHCMHPMIEKAQQIEHLIKDNQKDSLEKEEYELNKIRTQVEDCSANIRQKYGEMSSPIEKQQMLQSLKDYCPESFEIISKGVDIK